MLGSASSPRATTRVSPRGGRRSPIVSLAAERGCCGLPDRRERPAPASAIVTAPGPIQGPREDVVRRVLSVLCTTCPHAERAGLVSRGGTAPGHGWRAAGQNRSPCAAAPQAASWLLVAARGAVVLPARWRTGR